MANKGAINSEVNYFKTYFYTYLDIPIVTANKNSQPHCLQFDLMNVIPALSLSLSLFSARKECLMMLHRDWVEWVGRRPDFVTKYTGQAGQCGVTRDGETRLATYSIVFRENITTTILKYKKIFFKILCYAHKVYLPTGKLIEFLFYHPSSSGRDL